MVKLALTTSPPDRCDPSLAAACGATSELEAGPAESSFHVAPDCRALGGVPAAFREWRAQSASRRLGMRAPALLGATTLHMAVVVLILLVEWSLVAPVPIPVNEIALRFEPAPSRSPVEPPQPASQPNEAPSAPIPPAASEPAIPPVAAALQEPAPPEPSTAPAAELAPPVAERPAPPVAKPPPPRPAAVAKARPTAPRQPPQRAPSPPSPPAPSPASAVPAAPPSVPDGPAPARELAAAPLVPPRPVDFAQGNRKPDYPLMARTRGVQGLVLLRVEVGPSGTPIAVTVATSSGQTILDDAAVAAVKTWRFSPATQAGIPIASFADVSIHFSLAD